MKTLHSSMYTDLLTIAGTATAGTWPASGSYKNVGGYKNFAFLIAWGANTATTTQPAYQVKQATNASGTLKVIAGGLLQTTASGDDKCTYMEFDVDALDIANGYDHVAITNSAGTVQGTMADGRVIFFFAWNARHLPVTQSAGTVFGLRSTGA